MIVKLPANLQYSAEDNAGIRFCDENGLNSTDCAIELFLLKLNSFGRVEVGIQHRLNILAGTL